MSGTQTGAVPIKQLIPNNVQSTMEQQARVLVYITMGGSIVCQVSDWQWATSHDSPSVELCVFSQ